MHGIGALVRTFTGQAAQPGTKSAPSRRSPRPRLPGRRRSPPGSRPRRLPTTRPRRATYRTTVAWYAGCASPRVQLLSTHRVEGVGDEATLLVLRDWTEPVTTQVVGVARTGGLTTTVVDTRTGMTDPDQGAGPRPERRPAGHGGHRPVHAARRRHVRGRPRGPRLLPGPGRQAPLPPGRGRPAAGARHRPALGRHQAAPGQGERRRDPLRRHRTSPGRSSARPDTRTFVIPAATQLPPEFGLSRDRRRAAAQAGAGLRRRHPRPSSPSAPTTTSAPTSSGSPRRRPGRATCRSGD